MERICEFNGCHEPAKRGRRLCIIHYNQSQAAYNRIRRAKAQDKASDPYIAKIEGADDIWKSVLANEEVVKRQEVGLAKVGYEKVNRSLTFYEECSRIVKGFILSKLYAWTGMKPLDHASMHPSIGFHSQKSTSDANEDPFASLEMPGSNKYTSQSSSESAMPLTDIEVVYKGCLGGRNNISLAILGGSGQGKSYTARYIIEALHRRNKYNHFLMITNEGSYDKPNNDIAFISNVFQTICWNRLDKSEHEDVNEAIKIKCEEWAKGHESMQTLVVIDDVSQELNDGEIKLGNLVSRGYHMRTDIIIIFHGVPKANVKALAPLRDNIEGVILTGTDLISTIYDRTQWFDASKTNWKYINLIMGISRIPTTTFKVVTKNSPPTYLLLTPENIY